MRHVSQAASVLIASGALVTFGLGAPAQAADNGKITFLSYGGVSVMDATVLAPVTWLDRTGARFPAFAPDGSRIAAVDSVGTLTTFLPDGTGGVTVATGASQNFIRPAWSPDSTRLAYLIPVDLDLSHLVISNATAGAPQQIVTEVVGQPDGSIAWSPDGSTLLYSANGIWKVPATGGTNPTPVTISGPDNRRDYGPSWSPDGSRFAFVRDCNGCTDKSQTGLWTAAADGSSPQQLVGDAVQSPPSWSPDGKLIAFATAAGANGRLHVVNSTGTGGQSMLMSSPGLMAPSWGGAPVVPKPVDPTPTPAPPPPLSAPTLVSAPAIKGVPEFGRKLTTSNGTWTGNPDTFIYQWNRCKTGVVKAREKRCTPISGATKSTYALTQEDLGYKISTKVMAANAQGRTIASSEAVKIPMPRKGKPVSVTFTILAVNRNGKVTVPVAVKGPNPVLSATVTIEEYGETVKAFDNPKEKVNVTVELDKAGQKYVAKRPIVMLTVRIYVITRAHGNIYSSEETIKTKATSQAR